MGMDVGLVFLTLFLLLILAGLIFALVKYTDAKRIFVNCLGWQQLDEEKQILHKQNQDLLLSQDYTSTANGVSSYGDKAFSSELESANQYSYQEISDQLTTKSERTPFKSPVKNTTGDQSVQEESKELSPPRIMETECKKSPEQKSAEVGERKKSSEKSSTGNVGQENQAFVESESTSKLLDFVSESPMRERRSSSLSSEDSFLERISDDTAVSNLTRAFSSESIDSTCSAMDLVNEDQDLGQLEIRLLYESASQIFHLWVLQALDVRIAGGFSDAEFWIVVFLLPHPKPLWRTQLKKSGGSNVQFHEEFKQCIRSKDLPKVALLCQMFHRRMGAQEVSLVGQTRVRLRDISLTDMSNSLWLSVLPHSTEVEDRNLGEILFSLSYIPIAERLTVVLSKIKHLKSEDDHTIEKSLVRVYLVQGTKVSKKKTSIKTITDGAATFNESMIFNLSQSKFNKVYLRVSITEVTNAGEHLTVGHVTVGSRRSGKELGHWQKLTSSENQNSRKPLAMWHSILPKKS